MEYYKKYIRAHLVLKQNYWYSINTDSCYYNVSGIVVVGGQDMKKFYKKVIAPILAVLVWLIVMILPYGISRLIVDKIER